MPKRRFYGANVTSAASYALAAHEDLVRRVLAHQPDITLAELKALLAKRRVKVGQTSIFRFCVT
jgi:hypothetical protein